MDLITQPGAPLTMSSREIAELTGKEHKHVLRDGENMLADLGLELKGYVQNWTHPQNGQTYRELILTKDLTITLVSGYSVEVRHRIVSRWLELEAKASPAAIDVRDIRQLAPLALQLVQVVQEQQAQLEAQAPKVAFAEQVAAAENDQTLTEVAKSLGVGPRKLFRFLRDKGILRRDNLPMQAHMERGRFRVVQSPYTDPKTGRKCTRAQTVVTARGITFVQQSLARGADGFLGA